MVQRKAISRKRIQESSCAKIETVEINICTSRNDNMKIMQPIRIKSGVLTRMRK